MRFFIQNFGCRATQADGAALEGLLAKQGFAPAEAARAADLVILNTCTVTSSADDDVRKSIHRVHRENPGARILVTGCYAQRSPAELSQIPGVTWVVGNSHKTQIPDLLPGLLPAADYHGQVPACEIIVGDIREARDFLSSPVDDAFGDRTRPNLKIQEGCNNPCTFCIIPSVRGRSRSMSTQQVLAEIRSLAGTYREIVLTGINLGRWGREAGFEPERRLRLDGLLRLILEQTSVERLRISSVEPMDLSDDLLDLMAASPRIAAHVHAPLQSGSDSVLRRMKRRYRTRHYEDRILRAHRLLPHAAFGADVMTGFPGESDDDFRQTFEFIERLPLTYLHVFTYSARPGTPAFSDSGQVPHPLRKQRTRLLRELAEKKNLAFRRAQIGRTLRAVTLDNGKALPENYLAVDLAAHRPANRLVELKIGGLTAGGLAEESPFNVLPS
ncbi:MAG: tRNA (N(6)-L-threonylcarbamoyladenosine(37)-C(2))-methylthiotransferase MtaB [Acidobacteria bacterium]|nr:tRNA (N(6)-L-threonylcarbamoyladenosine(37)-C(2))-methylthiotransferase MtaB [Acidobacteriota bacterium]